MHSGYDGRFDGRDLSEVATAHRCSSSFPISLRTADGVIANFDLPTIDYWIDSDPLTERRRQRLWNSNLLRRSRHQGRHSSGCRRWRIVGLGNAHGSRLLCYAISLFLRAILRYAIEEPTLFLRVGCDVHLGRDHYDQTKLSCSTRFGMFVDLHGLAFCKEILF